MKVRELITQLLQYDMIEEVNIKLGYIEGTDENPFGTLEVADIDKVTSWHGEPILEFTDWREQDDQ